jgi:plastocyanin
MSSRRTGIRFESKALDQLPKRFLFFPSLLLVAYLFSACAGNSPQKPATQLLLPTRKIDPATTGSVAGKIVLQGAPPAAKPIDMSAEPFCANRNTTPVLPQQVVTGDAGSLANVVVYVKDFPADYIVDPAPSMATLTQRGCMYDPHVVALRAGQTLEIKNDDQATHNILAMPSQNPKWNRSETPGAAPIDETFASPEIAIPLRCNVHPWMKSYVFVFSHPYYAVTGKDGQFELKNLPPGTYTIEAWQEKYGVQESTITIGAKESKPLNFAFSAASGAGN